MNNRIRDLRTIHLKSKYGKKCTQQEFADRLGLSQNFIWQIEKGERDPSDRTITDICREFHVREDWLRTGEGDVFTSRSRDASITAFMGEIMHSEDADFRKRLVAVLSKLDTSEWELLEKMALKLAEENKKEDQA